jgi:chromosome segregation ATPase
MTDALLHPTIPEVNLPAKIINLPIMNQEESTERDQREERYTDSQRVNRDINYKIDILVGKFGDLTGSVEDLKSAIQGDTMGNEGLLPRMAKIEKAQRDLKEELDEVKAANAKKLMYLIAFFTMLGVVGGYILDRLMKK